MREIFDFLSFGKRTKKGEKKEKKRIKKEKRNIEVSKIFNLILNLKIVKIGFRLLKD